jgi:hypothetical protein
MGVVIRCTTIKDPHRLFEDRLTVRFTVHYTFLNRWEWVIGNRGQRRDHGLHHVGLRGVHRLTLIHRLFHKQSHVPKRVLGFHRERFRTPWNIVGRVIHHGGLVARASGEVMILGAT